MNFLFLIDGHGLIYRAYFALPYLANSFGLPTNAIFGFINMLFKLIKEERCEYIAVVYDSKKPSFRYQEYKEYKATRPKAPDEFKIQLPYLYELLNALGIVQIEKDGYEADDVIGGFIKRYRDYFEKIYIVSADKDIAQLVNDKVNLIVPKKGLSEFEVWGKDEIQEKFGVKPHQIPDFLALCGDDSDNIPGVKGIGQKTASKLLQKFHSIEELYESIDWVDFKNKEELLKNKAQVLLNKKLARLNPPAEFDIELDVLKRKKPRDQKAIQLLSFLEFRALFKELQFLKEAEIILSELDIDELEEKLKRTKEIGITEEDQKIAIAIKDSAFVYMLDRKYKEKLKELINKYQIKVFLYDLKSNIFFFEKDRSFDVSIGSFLLNPDAKHQATDLSLRYLGKFPPQDEQKNKFFDAYLAINIKDKIIQELKEKELQEIYFRIELPLIEVLRWMEDNGIKVDKLKLKLFENELTKRIEKLTDEIYKLANVRFNLNSPKQVSEVLFNRLKLPQIKKAKTISSTDEEVLNKLQDTHPIVKKIIAYRELSKLKSSYIEPFFNLISQKTQRIHSTFSQTQIATARIASIQPNLQTIPIKGQLSLRFRECFIPEDGFLFLSADYSQIELRILAHLSEDEELINVFKKNQDIHQKTAEELFANEEKEIARRKAKIVNFGIIYGMNPYSLSKELNTTPQQAGHFIEKYFLTFKKVKEYIEEVKEYARGHGFIRTPFGRLRYVGGINSPNVHIRGQAERVAINTPIQSTAADLIKLAMIDIYQKIDKQKAKLILQIHDELIFEVMEDYIDKAKEIIKESMENIVKFKIPIVVNLKVAGNLAEVS